MNNSRISIIGDYLHQVGTTLSTLPMDTLEHIVELLDYTRQNGRSVFVFGNGGSAATASHFACDLSKGAIVHGEPRLRVAALTDNAPLFSAWSNDTCYDEAFSQQLENWLKPGDVAFGISASGNSANVINGIRTARRIRAHTICLTGFDGGSIRNEVDLCMIVPSHSMEQVEDIHLLLCHIITTCLRTCNYKPLPIVRYPIEDMSHTTERSTIVNQVAYL
ncbi:MAG: SIS domain-containing protein [Chloroflexota bacterium]|nr:SIS domain-containing protein [Chloroflexota bacterium]